MKGFIKRKGFIFWIWIAGRNPAASLAGQALPCLPRGPTQSTDNFPLADLTRRNRSQT
jgi:hypothetical protein